MSDTFQSKMKSEDYSEGYWERGEGSNYVAYGNDPGWQPTIHTMREFVPDGSSVREVASAKGYFLQAGNPFYDMEGIDISEHAVACAPHDVRGILHLGNATNLPWGSSSADAVCSWEFLEHVYNDEQDQVLGEMERVLKPGGWMWHRIGIDMEGAGDPSHQQHDHTHVFEMTDGWWREHFASRGWDRQYDAERAINETFWDRDWRDRFYVYRVW